MLAAISLAACIFQFTIGRRIGSHYGDKIATSQSLGQKNTILAIWLTLTYLNPIISVAPAAYVAWHNTFNSLQIYRHEKSTRTTTNPPTHSPQLPQLPTSSHKTTPNIPATKKYPYRAEA